MSCSVKISSGKSWSGSQRRIASSSEESTSGYAGQSSTVPGNSTATSQTTPVGSAATSHALGQQLQSQQFASANSGQPPRPAKSIAAKKGEDTNKLLKYIDDNVVGKNGTFFGPFGRRKVVYCDYTASGRSLQFLEDYITREVLPCLGDTRASTSICSLQSSLFRHEARDIVRHATGAGDQDAVLFTGHGTDDALRTLLRHLDLPTRPTVVFVGPFEHHANLRPWREHGSKVVRIAETREGFLDLNDLERKLAEERAHDGVTPRLVGCFSAASCITGVLADDVATTLLLHQYGALSVWDYTSAAPFVQMDMNPHLPGVGETAVHKDAIIFSGHKFMGGAQSPGVLVTKRCLLRDDIGTEDMRDSHRYLRDPELREESGTAGVVESIRCGLAVQLKENVTPQAIIARQDKICRQVLAHVRTIPELILLGNTSQNVKRVPIFSFMVRHPRGTFLHHNFVCAILNDVFGVQARGGCACAGRYAHDLMGIDEELAKDYEEALIEGKLHIGREESNAEALRPGFARLSLPYFMSETELAFVLEALKMVATEGWKLLPQYVLNPDTGEWRHHTNSVFKERKWLGSIRYTDGKMIASERRVSSAGGIFPQSHGDCLQTARNIFNRSRKMAHRYPMQIDRSVCFTEKTESLRWFILPSEAQDLLLGNSQNVKQDLPFDPTMRKNHALHRGEAVFTNSPTNQQQAGGATMMRRLNSDIPRTGSAPVLSSSSPRHHSLPALSVNATNVSATLSRGNKLYDDRTNDFHSTVLHEGLTSDELDRRGDPGDKLRGAKLEIDGGSSSRPESPMPPVKFALGEAVTTSMILGTTPAGARLMAGEHSSGSGSTGSRLGRARCNSLGSTAVEKTSPVPIPLSPQILASLGLGNSLGNSAGRRQCQCNSRGGLSNSLEYDVTTDLPIRCSPISSNTSSPTSSSSPTPYPYSYASLNSHHHHHHHHHQHHDHRSTTVPSGNSYHSEIVTNHPTTPRLGRCSPILPNLSQSTEDDLRAYLKEVTKELATEIKSEIREVISKVDDVLSESNSSEFGTPQHHSHRHSSTSNERTGDSFSATEIAEYLMEYSKEMASEVKSEIRCMVNAVDGLGRNSPDPASTYGPTEKTFTTHVTPERRGSTMLPSSPLAHHKTVKSGKLNELLLSHQDSKMSSECSSDETVIYVVGPRTVPALVRDKSKTSDDDEPEVEMDRDNNSNSNRTTGKPQSIVRSSNITSGKPKLPEIYATVNSVSSQDSGINLSFHDSDARSLDQLGRSGSTSSSSSSGGSSSAESYGNNLIVKKIRGTTNAENARRNRDEKLPNDHSDDEIMREESYVSSDDEDDAAMVMEKITKKQQSSSMNDETCGPQWHSPPKNVWKSTVEAIHEFDMIRDKDRILICLPASTMGLGLSVGKYSLALLHTLHQYRFYARSKGIDFDVGAVTIDAGSTYDPMESMSYLKALQVPYFYEEAHEQTALIEPKSNVTGTVVNDAETKRCNVCGRFDDNTRKRLYAVAKRYGYNVLALGQNLDDLADDFFASLFNTGKLRTMKAHYYVKEYDVRVTRPFVYVRERALRQFVGYKKLPLLRVSCDNCEKMAAQKCQQNRELMAQQERACPRLYWSLRTALRPLILARGSVTHVTNHQQNPRQRHKLKSKLSPSCPSVGLVSTSQELDDSLTDEEPIV